MTHAEQLADTIPVPAWPKDCGCGRSYGPDAWKELAYVGPMFEEDDDVSLELRNCPCGSTIAQVLT